jgi:paraquat-inducible protein B
MTKKASPALTGAFVIGALLLVVAAVVIWGSPSLFERKYEYLCYFAGSVNGLNRGAPVKYQGVEVGVVKEIRVRYRQAPDDTRIPVFIEGWGNRMRELGVAQEPTPVVIQELIARGLRARLEPVSLVTGVLYVSLGQVPDSPISYAELPGPGGLPEIPTVPTELEEVTKSVTEVLAHLKSIDFKGTGDSVSKAALAVDDLVRTPELRTALKHLPRLISAAHELAISLDADANKTGLAVDEARLAMETLRGTLASANGVIDPRAPLSVELARTLSEVGKAATAVSELADFLRRNPHAIIAGTTPRGATE